MDKYDPRWGDVHATYGPPQIRGVDIETGYYKTLERFMELRFVVPYNGIEYHSVTHMSKDELEEFQDDLFRFVADRMVEIIDSQLEVNSGSTG